MSIYTKLNQAREEFHASKIKKTGFNSFAKYEYFELGDFIVPALAIFKKFGLLGYVSFGKEMASLTIVDADKPDERIVIESPMSTCEMKGLHAVQQLGAVQSYLRRYLWVAALEIVEHDALDATTGKKVDGPVIPARPTNEDLNMDEETIVFLREVAADVVALVESGDPKAAIDLIHSHNLDSDQSIALANMMDSKTRAALKKAKT